MNEGVFNLVYLSLHPVLPLPEHEVVQPPDVADAPADLLQPGQVCPVQQARRDDQQPEVWQWPAVVPRPQY